MIKLVLALLIIGGVAAVAIWAIDALGTPEPVRRVSRVVIIVVALLLIIGIVANLFGIDTGIRLPA